MYCIDGKPHESTDNISCSKCGRSLLEIKSTTISILQDGVSMQEIRCTKCEKLLVKKHPYKVNLEEGVKGSLNIKSWMLEFKCPRCKTLNEVVV